MTPAVRGDSREARPPTARRTTRAASPACVDTAESSVLIRNLLLAQHDGNAAIVLAGPATGLVRILDLYRSASADHGEVQAAGRGRGSAARRSRRAERSRATSPRPAGCSPSGRRRSSPSAPKSATRCRIPAASIEKDFAWSPAHPVVDAYRAFKPMPYDAPAPALAAVLYAVHPDDGYFTLSGPGHDQRARRRPDAVHAAGRRQASISDRRSGAEGSGRDSIHVPGVGAAGAAAGTSGGSRMKRACRGVWRSRPSRWLAGGEPQSRRARHLRRRRRRRQSAQPAAGGQSAAAARRRSRLPAPAWRQSRPAYHPPTAAAFDAATKSLFDDTCGECHNSTELAGGLDVALFRSAESLTTDRERWELILAKLKSGEMPPPRRRSARRAEIKTLVVVPREPSSRAPTPRMQPDPGTGDGATAEPGRVHEHDPRSARHRVPRRQELSRPTTPARASTTSATS